MSLLEIRSPLAELHDQIVSTAERSLEDATTLPPAAYTDPGYHAWEVEHVFRQEWVAVAHVSQVPNVGDYLNLDYLGEPLTVVRGKDGVVRVLSRVCRHRGMDVMPKEYGHPETGNARVILCPYHFWGYELDGHLKGAPEMHKSADFNRKEVCLHAFRSEEFEGHVFVTMNADLAPLAEAWSELRDRLAPWGLANLRVVADIEWDCKFDWKVLAENFMEPYHHMGAHSKTFEPMLPARGCWTEDERRAYAIAHLPLAKHIVERIDAGDDADLTFPALPGITPLARREWYVAVGFPTWLLFLAPDRAYWYRVVPTGPGRMKLLTTMLFSPDAMNDPGYDKKLKAEVDLMRRFHMEDMEMCEAVQTGMGSRTFTPGRLSHLEKPVWLIQRYLARKIREAGA